MTMDKKEFALKQHEDWKGKIEVISRAKIQTPEELAENKIVREKYLSNSFVLRRKDFQLNKDE